MNTENSSVEDNLQGQQKPQIQKSPPKKTQNTTQNFEWISCLYDLKQNQGEIEVIQNLSPSIVLNVPQNQNQQNMDQNNQDMIPKTQLKIEMNKDFIFTDGLGWNWHKSWNIPDLYCNLDIRDPNTNEKLLPPSKLHAELFVCRAMINDISTFHLLDVGVKGTAKADFDGTKAVFSGLKFSSTSYNFEGSKFHLVIVIYLTQTKFEHPKILESRISPPIFVDSRKSARDTQKQKIQKISSFIDPFTIDNLEKVFVKREAKRKQTHEEIIQNSYEGLCNFFSAPNIRHKVKHPIFLASRFSSCISLYYNSDLLGTETDIEQLIKKIQASLFTNCSSNSNKNEEINPKNGNLKPLILFLKTSPVPARKESINSVSKDKEKDEGQQQQVLTQNSKPVQEFMEPLIQDCIQLVQEEQDIPAGFTCIKDVEELQKAYIKIFEELKIQKESFDAKEEENNLNEEQKEENQNLNSTENNNNNNSSKNILSTSLKRKRRQSKTFNSVDEPNVQKQLKGSNGNIELQQPQTGSNSFIQDYLQQQQQQQSQAQPQNYQQNQEISVFPFGPQSSPALNPFNFFQQQQQQENLKTPIKNNLENTNSSTSNKPNNNNNQNGSAKRKQSMSQKKEEKIKQKLPQQPQQQKPYPQQNTECEKSIPQQEAQKLLMQQQQQQIMLDLMKNSQNPSGMLQNWIMMYSQMQEIEKQQMQKQKKDINNNMNQSISQDSMQQVFNQMIQSNPSLMNTMMNYLMNQYFQQQNQQAEMQKFMQSLMMVTQPQNNNQLEDQFVQQYQQYLMEQFQKQQQQPNPQPSFQHQPSALPNQQFTQQELMAQMMLQYQQQQQPNQFLDNSQMKILQQQFLQQQQQQMNQNQPIKNVRKNSSIQQPKPRKKSSVDITLLIDNTNNNKKNTNNNETNQNNNTSNTTNNTNTTITNTNNNSNSGFKKKIITPQQSPKLGSIHKSSISSEKGTGTATTANSIVNANEPQQKTDTIVNN